MLLGAAAFWQFILALHIAAVVVAFGVLFIYPLLGVIGLRLDPQAMPSFHRLQLAVHTRVQAPGLGVVVLAGIYLASYLDEWSQFFVGWGLAASIVIGGIGGAYIAPRERRLAELADQEAAAVPAAAGGVSWSDDYRVASRQADLARLLQLVLAAATILFMSLQL
jgi:hypothetical protein